MQVDLERTWAERIKETLELIRSLEAKDRLNYVASIALCARAISDSMLGWVYWMSNLQIMNNFDESVLRKFHEKLRTTTIDLLEFDLETTNLGIEVHENKNLVARSSDEET